MSCKPHSPKLVLVVGVTLFAAACQPEQPKLSELNYLQNADFQCSDYSAERINAVKNLPSGFLTGYQGAQMDTAVNRMAGIPDRDMDHLIWTFQSQKLRGVHPAMLGFGIAGLTSLTMGTTKDGYRGSVATAITTGASQAGFALQHEVGHAVEIKAHEAAQKTEFSDFSAAMRDIHSELVSKSNIIRGYARTNPAESFAESYANFYCSPQTHNFIRDNLPTTYKILSKVLVAPRWAQATTITNNTPTPNPINQGSIGGSTTTSTATTTSVNTSTGTVGNGNGTIVTNGNNSSTTAGANKPKAGLWLDKLIAKFFSYLHVDKIPAGNAPDAASYPGQVDAIRLALSDVDDGSGDTQLLFAANQTIYKIMLCFAEDDSCGNKKTLSNDEDPYAIHMERQIGDRNLFASRFFRKDQLPYLQREWVALGYSVDNKLIAKRKFILEVQKP